MKNGDKIVTFSIVKKKNPILKNLRLSRKTSAIFFFLIVLLCGLAFP